MMPFKFGFRNASRYKVSSKHTIVVCVHVLDHQLMDCVLTWDSTGQECLDNVTCRLGINDTQYFGLRYVDKRLQYRWVDLDKPIKKQLDKYSSAPMLYFAIMFHVLDGLAIQEPLALYHYYLLLKNDVLEGRLACNVDLAVLLGAYSLQVELGDYDPLLHGANYLNSCDFLPKTMVADSEILGELAAVHQRLRGIAQITSQLQFIQEAQQLEGYGLEFYPIKDMSGKELLIGISLVGIYVKAHNDQPSVCFKWNDVIRFQRVKKMFSIETTLSDKPFSYQLDDSDSAKYLYKLCNLQMAFYKSQVTQQLESFTRADRKSYIDASLLQSSSSTTDNSEQTVESSGDQTVIIHDSDSSHNAADSPASLHVNSAAVSDQKITAQGSVHNSHNRLHSEFLEGSGGNGAGSGYNLAEHKFVQQSSPLFSSNVGFGVSQEALYGYQVPSSYRPTPDYDTLMQMRVLASHQQQSRSTQSTVQDVLLSYSQPDIGQAVPPHHSSSKYLAKPPVCHPEARSAASRPVDRSSSLVVRPMTSTQPSIVMRHSSTVTAPSNQARSGVPRVSYRSPPPYPRQSSSTPELASPPMHSGAASGFIGHMAAPRLAAMPPSILSTHSQFDGSVENLAFDMSRLRLQHGPMIEALLASNLQSSGVVGYDQFGYRPDVGSGYQLAESSHFKLDENYSPLSSARRDNSHQRYANDVTTSRHSPHIFQQQSQPPNARVGSGRTRTGASPKAATSTYVNVDERTDQEMFIFDQGRHELESMVRGLVVGPGDSVSHPGVLELAGSTGSVASSKSVPARQSSAGVAKPAKSYVTNDIAENVKPSAGSTHSLKEGQRFYTDVNEDSLARQNDVDYGVNVDGSPLRDERRQMLESKLESQLFAEFEIVAKKRQRCECNIATLERNRERNRFADVVPYDDNRVRLVPTKLNADGYINASHIRMTVAEESYWYIAAQGPLTNTVYDFWHMIWQYGIVVIAMLTPVSGKSENEKQRCIRYWPDKLGPQNRIIIDCYEVSVQCTSGVKPYVTSGLLVRHVPSGKQRVVWHLQFTDWPDHGCPANHHGFLDYLNEIEAIRGQVTHPLPDDTQSFDSTPPAPVLVHCSAGVGRTGVVILTQIMKALLENNQVADVPGVLRSLRDQRMFMVQTVTQYSYVYKTLVSYLQSSRLI